MVWRCVVQGCWEGCGWEGEREEEGCGLEECSLGVSAFGEC